MPLTCEMWLKFVGDFHERKDPIVQIDKFEKLWPCKCTEAFIDRLCFLEDKQKSNSSAAELVTACSFHSLILAIDVPRNWVVHV